MSRLLIVEDEESIADLEKDYLELSGFEVDIENDGDAGLKAALHRDYNLIILDVMLPGKDGFEICKQVRKEKNTPIILVSAKKEDIDKIRGLGLGADDYITKPFDTELLLYKIKAILQRSVTVETEEQEYFRFSNIYFDSVLRQLKVHDKEYKLSPKENDLLHLLCVHRNDFMPRELALRKIWKKENYFTARSMDVYIAKLRKLLRDDEGVEIINVHGEGFRLVVKH